MARLTLAAKREISSATGNILSTTRRSTKSDLVLSQKKGIFRKDILGAISHPFLALRSEWVGVDAWVIHSENPSSEIRNRRSLCDERS
jgi:hypothetical protein